MADLEQSHGLCESLARQREEAQRENERLRSSYKEAERTLGARERVHRHRVKGLEEQVNISCQIQTFSGSQGRVGSCDFPDPFLVCCVAAGIHPEGAAAAGDEETTTFSSIPTNVYGKLRKGPYSRASPRQPGNIHSSPIDCSNTEPNTAVIFGPLATVKKRASG